MNISISREQYAQMQEYAQNAYPNECCGLIFGRKDIVDRIELAQNVAHDQRRSFEIEPSLLILAEKAHRAGQDQLLGYFHSHPNNASQPSAIDINMMQSDGRIWFIVTHEIITAWKKNADGGIKEILIKISD